MWWLGDEDSNLSTQITNHMSTPSGLITANEAYGNKVFCLCFID